MAIEATPLDAAFEVELPPGPYPGLRPFQKLEWPIFFGREEMTDNVIHRLIRQHLVVVHGDSGCGKSSLIRAGVLAQLEQEHARSGVRWRTCVMLPREAPLRGLANEFAKLDAADPDRNRIRQIRRCLNAGRDAPAALAKLLRRGEDDHICILVDQFEELFSFARKHGRDEAQLFVDVLVGLQADPPPGLYVILTMRSEFLGVCARFKGLAEAVNKTQYLLPQMERPALMRAIREPATLYEGEVSRDLAERLIADAGGDQDQLPLIQHGLMLLWRRKAVPLRGLFEDESSYVHPPFELAEARMPFRYEDGPAWRLGLEDYQGSGLATLLSDHADEVMAAAAPDTKREKIVEHLFRALTDIKAEGSAVRRPQTLVELVAVTGSDEQTLRDIIDQFRANGVSFLTPYGDAPIAQDTLIDISHEALIRCWRKIADEKDGWLQREFQDGLTWQSLRMQANKFAKDKEETLSPASTMDRDAWLATIPSRHWCQRYGGEWEAVQRLMQASREARARQLRLENEFRNLQRKRWIRLVLIALSGVFLSLSLLASWNWREAVRQAEIAAAAQHRADALARRALLNDSMFRAEQGLVQLQRGDSAAAIHLALAGLPMPEDSYVRPWVAEVAGVLVAAIGQQYQLRTLQGHVGQVNAATFASDSARIVSGAADGTLRVWEAASGAELLVLRGHEGSVSAAGFSPDGTRVVSGSSDQTVRVWDAASGAELLILHGHEASVSAAAFSPDGTRIVSGSSDRTVRVWDAASGAELLRLIGHEGPVSAVGFSPDGTRIVSGSSDNTARIWDSATGRLLIVLEGHEGGVKVAAYSPDGGRIVTANGLRPGASGSLGKIYVWDAAVGEQLAILTGHAGLVWSASFSSDGGKIVSGSDDETVRIWDAYNGQQLKVLESKNGSVFATAIAPDGALIVGGSIRGTLELWNTAGVKWLLVLRGQQGPVNATAFSPDGTQIVSASHDQTVRVWDAASGVELSVLRGHEGPVWAAAFSPDGTRIVSGSDDQTGRVWDAASGAELVLLRGHEGPVSAIGVSPDGKRVVTGSADQTVLVWHVASGAELLVLRGHEGPVSAAAFSPDGTRIVSGSGGFLGEGDTTVRVWDALSGIELLVLRGHEGPVYAAAFSPDGARIVSGSDDQTVRVWDAASGAELLVLRGYKGPVWATAFSPDGARIVSGSDDQTVRVWDSASGEALLVQRGHEGPVYAAAFSPDGGRIVSGSFDNTVRVTWIGRSKQELIETARARLPRELTAEERRRFHLAAE